MNENDLTHEEARAIINAVANVMDKAWDNLAPERQRAKGKLGHEKTYTLGMVDGVEETLTAISKAMMDACPRLAERVLADRAEAL